MNIDDRMQEAIRDVINLSAAERPITSDTFKELCELCHVAKMYYDLDLGSPDRYRNYKTGKLVIEGCENGSFIVLYDNGHETDLKLAYPFFYGQREYVHAYIEFEKGIREEDLDKDLYRFLADMVYVVTSRLNMRKLLEFSEISDAQTGIPNRGFLMHKYTRLMKAHDPNDYKVLRINLKNFKYVNETAGSNAGDEVLIAYSRLLLDFIQDNEGLCHLGGDNFAAFIRNENLDKFIRTLDSITIKDVKAAPGRSFEVNTWIGVSGEYKEGLQNPLGFLLGQASLACEMAKHRFHKSPIAYDDALEQLINKGREVVAIFPKAVADGEIRPFFQAKVDMRTGILMGFEALARWIHDGHFIFPDQFIPVLEKEGLVPTLDMAILDGTCKAIRKWREMGLIPPRVSTNFSKKNLFVPDIEELILEKVQANGLNPEDIEIEITETLKESEYDRLIEFVAKLKKYGFHIAVDDFGTGYSSLSLIHNIDVDMVKIDKSFVDKIPGDKKSMILIESIVSIVDRLHFSTIAEGVETAEQGRALLEAGCHLAQGYYYSKPVDFEAATELIANPPFEPI